VERVEDAVARVVRIERKRHEAILIARLVRQAGEQTGLSATAIEVEITGECSGLLVEDVERPVQIVDEQASCRCGLLAHRADARK